MLNKKKSSIFEKTFCFPSQNFVPWKKKNFEIFVRNVEIFKNYYFGNNTSMEKQDKMRKILKMMMLKANQKKKKKKRY